MSSNYSEKELKDMFSDALDKNKQMFNDAIDKNNREKSYALGHFLSLLFWKNYGGGHLTEEIKQEIQQILQEVKHNRYGDDTWLSMDDEKIILLVNKIREKIGMKKIIRDGLCLREEDK